LSEAGSEDAVKTASERLSEYVTRAEAIRIFAHPDVFSFHASILLASLIAEKRDRTEIYLKFAPGSGINEAEGIFVGYSAKGRGKVKGIFIDRELPLFSKGRVESLTLNPVLQALKIMEAISLIKDSRNTVAYASVYQGLRTVEESDPLLSFIQAESSLKVQKKAISLIQTSSRTVNDSIYHTVDPFFASLSAAGHEKISAALKERGISPELPLSKLSEEEMKRLVELLLENLSYRSLKQPKKELLRPLVYYQSGEREYDLKEIGEAIDIALEVSPGSLISFYANEMPLEGLLSLRMNSLSWIGEAMRMLIEGEIKPNEEGIVLIPCDLPKPIHFLANLARKMGIAGSRVFACSAGGSAITSLFEIATLPEEKRNALGELRPAPEFPFVIVSSKR